MKSTQEWLDAIIASTENEGVEIDGTVLPGWPSAAVAGQTVHDGMSPGMLKHAASMYERVSRQARAHGPGLSRDSKVLDFGVGFGRIARFFLREVPIENIYGVEVLESLAKACRDTFGSENFQAIKQHGTLPAKADTFDVVFANSVFSHLTEERANHWFWEIRRVLKPGGLAVLTVIDQEKFADMIKADTPYIRGFEFDVEETNTALSQGKLIWRSTKRQGELEDYGLTIIPKSWVEENWTKRMQILDYDTDNSQAVVTLKKS